MTTFADRAIRYFTGLKTPEDIPGDIQIANPYESREVKTVIGKFYKKYFDDNNKRTCVFGINPGRFGGGLTGISFTDPVALREMCGIKNELGSKKELSSKFICRFINESGGPQKFYKRYYISALYPLALLKNGKNHNYYDSAGLFEFIKPHIMDSLKEQVKFGLNNRFVVSLGKKNAGYLKIINEELHLFEEIRIVEHPRYIMQYRLKQIDRFLEKYRDTLELDDQ